MGFTLKQEHKGTVRIDLSFFKITQTFLFHWGGGGGGGEGRIGTTMRDMWTRVLILLCAFVYQLFNKSFLLCASLQRLVIPRVVQLDGIHIITYCRPCCTDLFNQYIS